MSLRAHGIVEDTDDLDPFLSRDTEEDEVTGTIAVPGSVQGMQAFGDVGTKSCPRDRGAFAQACDGTSQDAIVEMGLFFAEPVGGPRQNAFEVGFGRVRQPYFP